MQSLFIRLVSLWFLFLFFSPALFACDDASVTLVSVSGSNPTTFTIDLCLEFNGLEGSTEFSSFTFNGTGVSVSSFTPATFSTSGGDVFTGSSSGNMVEYPGPWLPLQSGATLCIPGMTFTVTGDVTSIDVIYHEDYDIFPACQTTITIPPPTCPITAVDAPDITECEGTSFPLSASVAGTPTNPVTYTWTASPAGATSFLSSTTTSNPTVSASATPGSATFTVTMDDGTCSVTDDIMVTILASTDPTCASPCEIMAQDAPNINACQNDPISLTASFTGTPANTATYSWAASPSSALSWLSSTTTSNPSVTSSTPGNATFTVTIDDGNCTVTDNIMVAILPSTDPACAVPCTGSVGFVGN